MDDNIFERAKQSMSLVDFLIGFLGEKPITSAGHYRFKVCPHCGPDQTHLLMVFDDERYFCHRCKANGTIIDAAMIAQGFTNPLDAAKFLTGEDMTQAQRRQYAPKSAPKNTPPQQDEKAVGDAIHKVLKGILKISAKTLKEIPAPVMEYLTETRGFSEATIEEAIKRRFMLVTPGAPRLIAARIKGLIGEESLTQAGFMGDKGVKIIPYRPLVFPLVHKKSAEFRLARVPRDEKELKSISKGSRDHDVWYWKATEASGNQNVMICEGPMDMLACYEMGYKGHIFGLPGATSFGDGTDLINAVKAVSTEKTKIYLAFDADKAGQSAFQKLSAIFAAAGLTHLRMTYEGDCKDFNDLLLYRKQKASVVPTPSSAPTATAPAAAVSPKPETPVTSEAAQSQAVAATVAPAVAPDVSEPAPVAAKPKRKRKTTSKKPATPRKKKVEVPTGFFARVKLAVKVLFGG